jgi:outer membrane receptor for ferrienterochelin and colicins
MQKIICIFLLIGIFTIAKAQNKLVIVAIDSLTKQTLNGANITVNNSTKATNNNGIATFANVQNGSISVNVSYIGYKSVALNFNLPVLNGDSIFVYMEIEEAEQEEVIVQSTRTSRTIKNTPTRVETIDGEELDEKNNMRPANVSMLLHESSGIQVQQTSATNANASIRMQGLDGKYTQLLKDGYPNYGNFASGLSILEIPPLDLKQVEVIKGPASTLYGGGAIAGVINFISKTPKETLEGNILLNQSNIGQSNIGGFFSQKKGNFGFSILGLANFQKVYDVDKDHFSELPKGESYTLIPKLFYYPNSKTVIQIGNSYTKGFNFGGDIDVVKNKASANHNYFEKNKTERNITTFEFSNEINTNLNIKIKQSISSFNRAIALPNYIFSGKNKNTFTDLALIKNKNKHTTIVGLNVNYDQFKQKNTDSLNAKTNAIGIYIQNTWDATEQLKIESGLRFDHIKFSNKTYAKNQTFVLPRVSALLKLTDKITSRVSGGLGYKTPTIFNEITERIQYQNVSNFSNVVSEKSYGVTADVNYKTKLFEAFEMSVNQLFFHTTIHKPLILQSGFVSGYYFVNASNPIVTNGFETNLKFIYKHDLKLFMGYTFTNAKATYLSSNQILSLMPQHKLNLTLMYEKEDNFKLGLEGYFTDKQYLFNGTATPSFWEFGFMAQKTFNKISVYINFENFTDQRQSNYKTVVNPPHNNPSFDDIWNHTEGFVINGGIKIKL